MSEDVKLTTTPCTPVLVLPRSKLLLLDCCVLALQSATPSWYPSACQCSAGQASILSSRDVKVNGRYYRDVMLMQELLRDIRQLTDFYVFQQDSAPMCRAHETFDRLTKETPDFIPPTLWPPKSPDLNLVDDKVWSVMQQKVYKKHIKDVDELRSRILTAWDEPWTPAYRGPWTNLTSVLLIWQSNSGASICTHVKAKGGHFEQNLASSFRPLLV